MKFFTLTKLGLALLMLTTAVAVGLSGCGDDNGTNSGGGNNIPAVDPSTVVRGTFTDDRDNQTYKTVKIGSQTWMAENLNYETDNSMCYDDADSNCVKYGRLYTWDPASTACPRGWHLPDTTDWVRLMKAVGGRDSTMMCFSGRCFVYWFGASTKLKATSGWDYQDIISNGTDDYGFSALPGGFAGSTGLCFGVGTNTIWWTAKEICEGGYCEHAYDISTNGNDDLGVGFVGKSQHYSVRCIADD
ncbi:MAG: fibrobacter succinogenes major paralogous domain-containing protein [Chitinispirillales bacterium]|nr:fibrobacter succinogenes major paralogous domain-containing protein [Chitinispirillales bacterium]